jgi:hypothetical protein
MIFFVGMHQPYDAWRVGHAFISVHRLAGRIRNFPVGDWIMDSGAFTTIAKHGGYPMPVSDYAWRIRAWAGCGNLLAAVAQDYMCEPSMLAKTGLTIADHQRLTIERYDELLRHDVAGIYVMPVLQGYAPADYAHHIRQYGARLTHGAWVGVGSVCKRNGSPQQVLAVLAAINAERPDLQLHGFGLKTTSLDDAEVRKLLYSADSMAWSAAARWEGKGHQNSWRSAVAFSLRMSDAVDGEPVG